MPTERAVTPAEEQMYVKTKIVATIGPASQSPAILRRLVEAGVDVFRLNFAHGEYDWFRGIIGEIRRISVDLGQPIGILADLAGPKIRLEQLPGGVMNCVLGDKIHFVRTADPDHPEWLTSTYLPLVDELNLGDRVLLADGTVGMRVIERDPELGRVTCEVDQPGPIRNRQGINLPDVVLSTPSLTEKDRDDLEFAVGQGVDFIGLSFVRSADDISLLRGAIDALQPNYTPQIVAKIEKMEAVHDLERILDLTDAVMVARGDLGVEVDLALVPVLQKRIIKLCNQRRIPVITATQMLDSMQHNSRPTRAEANDVANAVLDGTDAVMLSGETAAGEFPIESVVTMARIAREAEKILPITGEAPHANVRERTRALAVTEAVCLGAGRAADHLRANLIVIATRTGKTALAVSRQRTSVPILGVTDREETARRLCLFWGIVPLVTPLVDANPQELLTFVVDWCRQKRLLHSGGKLVLIASSNWSAEGHDMLLVHAIP